MKPSTVLCLLAIPLGGCGSGKEIQGRDSDVLFPTVRVTYDVLKAIREKKAGQDPPADPAVAPKPTKRVQGSFLGELDLSYGRGSSKERMDSEGLELDDKDFIGPAEYKAEYDIFRATAGVRGGFWIREVIGLEGMAGLSASTLDLKIRSNGVSSSMSNFSWGLVFGLQASVRPIRELTLYGRAGAGGSLTFNDVPGVGGMTTLEAGASIRLVDRFSILGGWRSWEIEQSRRTESDVELDFSGPFFGFELSF